MAESVSVRYCMLLNDRLEIHRLKCMIFILCLLSSTGGYNAANIRIQRRFMWKQMDMNGIMGGVASGARVMKNMFGELLPTIQTTANILDYLPSETTRVKYIIRNPTSKKPTKIIKIRPPKKVIKIITAPKTFLGTQSLSSKPEKNRFLSVEEMNELEREQEMIAEGRLPLKSDKDILVKVIAGKSHASDNPIENNSKETNDSEVVNGKIVQFGNDGWLPVYESPKSASQFPISKPYIMSQLHTSIMAEALPRPEKQVYFTAITTPATKEYQDSALLKHYYETPAHESTYEVTEYIADETAALPFVQSFRDNSRRGFLPLRNLQPSASNSTEATTVRSKTLTHTTSITKTTTEEPPNYPASFLRRYRERTVPAPSTMVHTPQLRLSALNPQIGETALETPWVPTNINKAVNSQSLRTKASIPIKSEKWPPQLPIVTASMPVSRLPFSEIAGEINNNVKKVISSASSSRAAKLQENILQQSTQYRAPQLLTKPNKNSKTRDLNNRGTVKFGDKPNSAESF